MESSLYLRKNKINIVSFIIFAILMFIRFPIYISASYKVIIITHDLHNKIMILVYFLTNLFVYINRKELYKFNITKSTLLLFLIMPMLRSIFIEQFNLHAFYNNLHIIPAIIAVLFSIAYLFSYNHISFTQEKNYKKFWRYMILGIIFALTVSYFMGQVMGIDIKNRHTINIFGFIEELFLTQMFNAAFFEEFLFRSFLWHYLERFTKNQFTICLIQAFLFWMAHIYYLGNVNYSFWIVVPLSGFLFGFLVLKTKSITTSIICHTLTNSVGQLCMFYKF